MAKRQQKSVRPPGISDRAALYSGDAHEHKDLVDMLAALASADSLTERCHVLGQYIDPEKLDQVQELFSHTTSLWQMEDRAGRQPSSTMMLLGASMLYEAARAELTNSLRAEEQLHLPLLYESVHEVALAEIQGIEHWVEELFAATPPPGAKRPRRGKQADV